jgi:5,6,7,8-tetrahydromethanopterin hydro-lyase
MMLNKMTVASDLHGRITWGAAQLGVGQGVMDCVADGTLDATQADELVLLVGVWVDPAADDETAVRLATRRALAAAIADARSADRSARVAELVGLRDGARNAFYSGA